MTSTAPADRRERALEALSATRFDLLVVGAGIVGSRIAYEAARLGMRVASVDAGDFGGATSSASSKLVHGGLRYLAEGHLGLVRAARLEQHALRTRVAPHLVRELPLVLAIDRSARLGPHAVAAGLTAYDALSGFRARDCGRLPTETARQLVPALRVDTLSGCALVSEAQTNDARLTLATVRAAEEAGAVVCNYVGVVALERMKGLVRGALLHGRPGEGFLAVRFRAAIGATGPWADELRKLEDPRARPVMRLSKGVHAVFPGPGGWKAGLAVSLAGGRAFFALPWEGLLLIGVTDTAYDGDPAAVAAEPADLDGLVEGMSPFLPPELLRRERMVASFAGLRALPRGNGDTLKARRDHVVSIGPAGLVSVAGGKLTTHRRIALDALRSLPREVRPRRLAIADEPLPGAGAATTARLSQVAGEATTRHLVSVYGSHATDFLAYADRPDAFQPIHPAAPEVWAQVDYAAEREWALTPLDVARRRTTLALRGLAGEELLHDLDGRLTAAGALR